VDGTHPSTPAHQTKEDTMTITLRTYGHGSITLTAYESSRRIRVEATAENSVMDWHELFEFVDAIRKPQQVTTVEELDALPVGTVVHWHGTTAVRSFANEPAGLNWVAIGSAMGHSAHEFNLPVTVLHVGDAE
jgi:hypothetical protein